MRERINRLARGMIDNGIPELKLKPERIEAQVEAGETVRGEFTVNSANNLHIKGLAYSSSERVRVINSAFGGLRNRIAYEIDGRYLEAGDEIKGSFYLITNGGEREIPYSLQLQEETESAGLEKLRTPRDFAKLARKNLDAALRMFEYQDFVQAPFMADAGIRAIYEGLRGRGGRRSLLEEFLVALHVKEAVTLRMDQPAFRIYRNVEEPREDSLELTAIGWGYLSAAIQTDASFVQLETVQVTDRDFVSGRCRIAFSIRPEKLHGGKNYGRIRVLGQHQEFTVEVEAWRPASVREGAGAGERLTRKALFPYLSLRLDYETGMYEPAMVLNQMNQEMDRLRGQYPHSDLARLLQAELLLLAERKEQAALLLDEARDGILAERETQLDLYCGYQYLRFLAGKDERQREALIRYLKKLLWEEGRLRPSLFLLLLRLDGTLAQNPLELYRTFERLYRSGGCSPFLYIEACRLIQAHPELLTKLGEFELQYLRLGLRKGLVSRETALQAAKLILNVRYYRRMTERLALSLYEAYPETALLEAVCSILIRGEKRNGEAFLWYERALNQKVNLTRLYEYFLYALPQNYGHLLPKEILLYFSYEKGMDYASRCTLYRNILLYMNPSLELYQTYTRSMEQFAMEQLFQGKISESLAVIYEHMIYPDIIDSRIAHTLPGILKSWRVTCEDPRMRSVVVRYEELEEEHSYPLTNGSAYVPIYTKHAVLLFQDAYGSRCLNVKHRKMPVLNKPELLKRCYEVYPDHPMLRLEAGSQILEAGVENGEQAQLLEELMAQLRLSPVFAQRILQAVTDYYCRRAGEEDHGVTGCGYLIQMDKASLGPKQRQRVCETLIRQNYLKEAYAMMKEYGSRDISSASLLKLCTRMILQQLFDQDELLLQLAWRMFQESMYDSVLLDYLCEHFNGTVEQMYRVLIAGVKEHVETYDLEERLLCQMLFTGSCGQMDSVFDLYMKRKKTRESVVKAYFTEKSVQYFLEEQEVDDRVFAYLKQAVSGVLDKEKAPTIYLLALTKYFSQRECLTQGDRELCRAMTGILLEAGLVFPYTRQLSRHIRIPEEILDKAMIEYRGSRETAPLLELRVLPDEQEFHVEELRRVYQGIYVKEKVLFDGEVMEYRIYENGDRSAGPSAQGQAVCDNKLEGRESSRFACLNRMGAALAEKDEKALEEAMEDYRKRSAALSRLFPIEASIPG